MPERIRLSRAKGWRMPPGTVKVDRSTAFGNPWKPGNPGQVLLTFSIAHGRCRQLHQSWFRLNRDLDAHGAVMRFSQWLRYDSIQLSEMESDLTPFGVASVLVGMLEQRRTVLARLPDLYGKNLACWCPADSACHADALLEIIASKMVLDDMDPL